MAPTPYLRKKDAAKYCAVSPRKFHDFLNGGLRHVRVPPGGTILTRAEWIDEFLGQYEATEAGADLDHLVDEVVADVTVGGKR